jgi:hypothetical protein
MTNLPERVAKTDALFALPILSKATADSGLLYQEILSHEAFPIQHRDSPPSIPLGGHFNEGKPLRLTSLSVLYDLDRHNISGTGEKGPEFGFARLQRKIGDVNFLIYFRFPIHFPSDLYRFMHQLME